ncbi:MAG: DUF262 domain-containing protein [Planctomycetes bacterium]|nr:DUF262 domain-containing protein [Planctomycetota bacterium]
MEDTPSRGDLEFSDPREEDEANIDEIPKEQRSLRTQAYDKSISDVVSMIDKGDIVLDPDYQRNYIWDDKLASLLVESILLNVPIPVIYVAEDEDSRWDVVDGLQRLNSLHRFFKDDFRLKGLEVLPDLNNLLYSQLNPKAARILRNGILRIILIFKESHSDIKYEIFTRLNRGSIHLNEQELRNCLYRGPFNDFLHEIRKEDYVLSLLNLAEPHKRMVDAELLLRHFTVKHGYDPSTGEISTYSGNMRSSLNKYMLKARNLPPPEIKKLKLKFIETVIKVYAVFEDNAFHRINPDGTFDGRLNRAVMDAVMIGFGYHSRESLEQNKAEIIALLKQLINDDATFLDAITVRTSMKSKMEYRIHTFVQKLAGVVKG